MEQSLTRKTGIFCLAMILLAMAPSAFLGCFGAALRVGGGAALMGAGMGIALAGVTRTRNATAIYLLLAGVVCLITLFAQDFPPDYPHEVRIWKNAPPLLENYLDFVRAVVFLTSAPYPFARWGHHAPDTAIGAYENDHEPRA